MRAEKIEVVWVNPEQDARVFAQLVKCAQVVSLREGVTSTDKQRLQILFSALLGVEARHVGERVPAPKGGASHRKIVFRERYP